ncbi:regulatory protein Cys-3 [Neurospora crassa OR74A]|uniref:regulatory protein Cys-3 n=1 Tax=Neurospora crassa (strain ATCC 24698 / 74-OR23-1A / CBS 708.71 / DSM 1257 / FGSC 987) TaxID=367110 RepID=UPI00015C3617|nr:regulatory protein Cys-3 [Neurospora crassa OR74A]EAA27579.2 regulatory protein Cys-3 [Neurospora crassa OR74A]|eukprot:XP_956815.2 regulatory protein Cys-3 [Neurospora crassa OR74A]
MAGSRINFTNYLRNLNVQEPQVEEYVAPNDEELALFTNTNFFDYETGQNTDYQAPPVKPDAVVAPTPVETAATSPEVPTDAFMTEFLSGLDQGLEFAAPAADFNFGDFTTTYTSPTIPAYPDTLGQLQPIQPNPQAAYPPVSQHHASHHVQHPHQPGYVLSNPPQLSGNKRKASDAMSVPPTPGARVMSFEEASRLAAEEDKRKRNTAASARFRIKKKQREQALEKSAKEMSEKVTQLEGRIQALETENKWLKGLVTEKHGSKEDILKLLREFSAHAAKVSKDAAAAAADKAEAAADKADAERAREESSFCVSTSSPSSDESVDTDNKKRRKD